MTNMESNTGPEKEPGRVLSVECRENENELIFDVTISNDQPLHEFAHSLYMTQESPIMGRLIQKGWVGTDTVIKKDFRMDVVGGPNNDGTCEYKIRYYLP